MASPPSPAPEPRWAVLCRKACTDPALPPGVGCRARGWRAPGLTELFVSPLVDGGSGALVRDPLVLAADPSGLLLLSGSLDGGRTVYFLCDAASNTVRQLPDAPGGCTGAAGLIVAPGDDSGNEFRVAELLWSTSDDNATLRCFSPSPDGGGMWSQKTLATATATFAWGWTYAWCTDSVLSHLGMLWWVDLSQGLLACNPFAAEPGLHFVPFPNVRGPLRRVFGQQRPRRDPSSQRLVGFSDGKLRYVVLTTRASVPKIKLWTLAHPESGKWTLDYELSCRDIWDDPNYNKTGLLNGMPTLALVHPMDPQAIFLFEKWHLYGFNMRAKTLTDCANLGIDKKDVSPTFALAWQLSPSLSIPAGRSPTDNLHPSAVDTIAAAFGNACDRAITDMEFHQFTKFALAELNKHIRKEENRFRVSERISICYFDDKSDSEEFEYAHINFHATNDSKMILVFAEVSRKGNGSNSWTLSSCKILTKKFHGGLYDEPVDVAGMTRKRKRSLYCFACRDKLKHPKGGFSGGHGPSTIY